MQAGRHQQAVPAVAEAGQAAHCSSPLTLLRGAGGAHAGHAAHARLLLAQQCGQGLVGEAAGAGAAGAAQRRHGRRQRAGRRAGAQHAGGSQRVLRVVHLQ